MNSIDKQLQAWVYGNPVHNKERDECTPDFSCCHPELLADLETRLKFEKAHYHRDHETTNEMLMEFLAKMLEAQNLGVAIVGDKNDGST